MPEPAIGRPGTSGFAARINLTIPLATLLGLAERPGEAAGLGALDPDLARTLATAAAGHPRTTWCVTVTDQAGHPTAHGCARPDRGPRAAEATRAERTVGVQVLVHRQVRVHVQNDRCRSGSRGVIEDRADDRLPIGSLDPVAGILEPDSVLGTHT
jgi:hypothetical protein